MKHRVVHIQVIATCSQTSRFMVTIERYYLHTRRLLPWFRTMPRPFAYYVNGLTLTFLQTSAIPITKSNIVRILLGVCSGSLSLDEVG